MRPTWLVEANVDGLPVEKLLAELRRQGMTGHVAKLLPGLEKPKEIAGGASLPMEACVVFRGTTRLMRHIDATRRWKPGGWCAYQNLSCATYYAHFGPFVLNSDYTLMPVAEASRLADNLFARHASTGQVFVRPVSVEKTFPGGLVDRLSFAHKIAPAAFDPTALLLVARPKKLTYEWRLIIANGNVVAASQYQNGDDREESPGCPDEVRGFATSVLNQVPWRPAPVFIMDVADSEDGLRIVELNSFGCSGHYSADVSTIVREASDAATTCW